MGIRIFKDSSGYIERYVKNADESYEAGYTAVVTPRPNVSTDTVRVTIVETSTKEVVVPHITSFAANVEGKPIDIRKSGICEGLDINPHAVIDGCKALALELFAKADLPVSEWAAMVLEETERMWEAIKAAGFENEVEYKPIFGDVFTIIPMYAKGYSSLRCREQIEYFLSDSLVISGGEGLCDLAMQAVNYDKLIRHQAYKDGRAAEALQAFFEEKVLPIYDKTFEEETPAEHIIEELFSDWHLEVYGHRPRIGHDKCYDLYTMTQTVLGSDVRYGIDDLDI